VIARLSGNSSTSRPTTVSVPVISKVIPSSNVPFSIPTSSTIRLIDLPTPTSVPTGLRGSFEAPHLIVPIDKADPSKVVGNGYSVLLSPTVSTVFVYDVRPEFQDKVCNLVFFMPPAAPFDDLSPAKIRSPGGIIVSRLNGRVASPDVSANNVGSSTPVGTVSSIRPDNQYAMSSMPCEGGQRVAYQIDSTGGLAMDFFQMTSPPLGLFMIPM
jgi:glucan endo-1,3-beta-D-glucosidase